MVGNPTPIVSTSRRQRLLAHLPFRSRASSPSTSSVSQPNQTIASSTAQIQNPSSTQTISSGTAPAEPVLNGLLTAGTAPLTQPQAASTPSSNPNLLRDVLERLSDDDRATLSDFVCHNASDINLALEQALVAAKEKKRCCIEKRWTFTFTGRTVDMKEEADKVVGWLDRFKAVGDIVANVDPMHVGLPWAGIRLLLKVKLYTPE